MFGSDSNPGPLAQQPDASSAVPVTGYPLELARFQSLAFGSRKLLAFTLK